MVRRDGSPGSAEPPEEANAWFTFSVSPVRTEDGDIVAFLNVVSESTQRVLAERAQEEVRAEAERAERRLLVGRPVFEALPEVRGQGFEALLDNVLETGEPFVGREVAFTVTRTPESAPEERFVDLVYCPITEANGTRSGVVAHGSDVTEHVLAREAQRARAETEQANQAKSRFLATMSHEIRTPINAIMGYADLLDAGVAGRLIESQQRYVDGIHASSRHLLGLVSDILDLAKIEAGEMG